MKKVIIGAVVSLLFVAPVLVFAQPSSQTTGVPPSQTTGAPGELINPLKFKSICGFFEQLFKVAIMIGVPVATLFIIWAGFKFVIARGNAQALSDARKNAGYVVLGIAIFLGAWVLSQIIAATIRAVAPSIGLASC